MTRIYKKYIINSFKRVYSTFFEKNEEKIDLINELKARGLIEVMSSGLESKKKILTDQVSVYMGVDPTAASLHIGNLVTLLSLFHFYLRGHNCYSIVGGGTSRIGDPSGRTKQRKALKLDFISENALKIENQLNSFFKNGLIYALKRGYKASNVGKYYIMNNLEWYDGFLLFDFLKIVGSNIRVGEMLARESVKNRLNSDQGISYAEFTYQLLQAYDFYYLNQNYNVSIQIGGNDQWGNIVAGIELINKINNLKSEEGNSVSAVQPYGVTVPLLLKKNGEKFSKSIGDTIWLNSDMTTPYQLYQFFIQSSDEIVEKYLRIFTLLPLDTISEIIEQHFDSPDKRYAQHKLAEEVVMLIHGQEEMEKSKMATQLLFSDKERNKLEISHIFEMFSNKKDIITLNKEKVIGKTVPEVIKESGVLTQINKLLQGGGIYTIKEKITSPFIQITEDWLMEGKVLIFKLGKKRHIVINVI
ncbi:tyrosine-tRNA ligase [Pneumocystis jirovecii RU7]|uniref:Tyrosine--tRNA ligase n=1 Tax=Pneumocystis jirovecii (strain RU7) TaxID=1408657 RepID=A0A0W4ZRX9_PNEJ7|nr:tyrosine-tRNA ligase [Pneumocystis jirovecii RU7]KTW31127.1 tyrosine-tRNA ligase [Pneumocystis jirovecii RU7]